MQLDGVVVELRQEMLDLCEELQKEFQNKFALLRNEFQSELTQERNERINNDDLLLEALDVWSKAEHQAAEESARLLSQLDGLVSEFSKQKLSIQELFSIVELRVSGSPKKLMFEPSQKESKILTPHVGEKMAARSAEVQKPPARLPRDSSAAGSGEAELMAMCSKALDHHKVIATLMECINFFSADLHWKILEPMREAESAPRRWTTFDFRSLPSMVSDHMEEVEKSYERLRAATAEIVTGFAIVVKQLELDRPGIISKSPDVEQKVDAFYEMLQKIDNASTGVQTLISTLRIMAQFGLGSEAGRTLQEWIEVVQPALVEARQECRLHEEATRLLISTVRGVLSKDRILSNDCAQNNGYHGNGNSSSRRHSMPAPLALESIAEVQEAATPRDADSPSGPVSPIVADRPEALQLGQDFTQVVSICEEPPDGVVDAQENAAADVEDCRAALDIAPASGAADTNDEVRGQQADDAATEAEVDNSMTPAFEAAPTALPAERSDELVDHAEEKVFLADNQFLKSSKPGLCYHKSTSLDDMDSERAFVPWGSMVYGATVCGGEWLKVLDRFLPTNFDGVWVLRPYSRHLCDGLH